MARNPRRIDAELDALYAGLPAIDCQGYCHDSCGPIETSIRERARIEHAAGVKLTCGIGPSCSMLTAERRCSVYELRPLICRLWGLTRSMPCPYGCKPERVVEDEEAMILIGEADRIGGLPARRQDEIEAALREQRAALETAEGRQRVRGIMRSMAVRPSVDGRHSLAKTIFDLKP